MTTDPLAAILADDNETEGATARRVEREHYAMTYIKGLHNLADFLSNHRDAIPDKFSGAVTVTLTGWTPEELATHIKALGGGEKFANDYWIGVARKFGPHTIQAASYRSTTCEAVPTGEVKEATKEVDPSAAIPEGAKNVRTKTITVYEVDEPVTSWVCPDSLLSGSEK